MQLMPPRIACPNCQQKEWLQNSGLNYFPMIRRTDDGTYVVETDNGVNVNLWRCNNCLYMMAFWEPD